MKIAGWIILGFGSLSLFGCIAGGTNPMGPLFWLGLGIFLIYRANQKEKEKDDWSNK